MIVVDTNVIAYLLLGGEWSEAAETALRADSDWAAPPLWRSEFTNVLALHVRARRAKAGDAPFLLDRAQTLIRTEPRPRARDVLELSLASGCSAYDCEFVAAALGLGLPLVTNDGEILNRFPDIAIALRAA